MGKSEIIKTMVDSMAERNNTIDLDAYAKGLEDMHEYIDNQLNSVFNPDSHSPTEPEFDTLQYGDWFEGKPYQYLEALNIEFYSKDNITRVDQFVKNEGMVFDGNSLLHMSIFKPSTQLTPEEFFRRAENTFKK